MAKVYVSDNQIVGIYTPGLEVYPTLDAPDGYDTHELFIDPEDGHCKPLPHKPTEDHYWDSEKSKWVKDEPIVPVAAEPPPEVDWLLASLPHLDKLNILKAAAKLMIASRYDNDLMNQAINELKIELSKV